MHHVECFLHLRQEMRLGHLIGMQLQAERIQSDLRESFLHHLQGGHLLSHEEHPLVLIKRVGNHVRDGLTLSRSWRTVEDEVLTTTALDDCLQL